jgi:hypothetical protein
LAALIDARDAPRAAISVDDLKALVFIRYVRGRVRLAIRDRNNLCDNFASHRIEQDIASIRAFFLGKVPVPINRSEIEGHPLVECRNWQCLDIPTIRLSLVRVESKPMKLESRCHIHSQKVSALEVSFAGFRQGHPLLDLLACDTRKKGFKIGSVEAILAHQSLNPV